MTSHSRFIWLLMLALLIWGVLLAVGTLIFPGNLAIVRGVLVLGCTLAFVGFWVLMLLYRNRRLQRGEHQPPVKFPPPGA